NAQWAAMHSVGRLAPSESPLFRLGFIVYNNQMFSFQIIKWFWNLWDHLILIILLNLLSLVLFGALFYLVPLLAQGAGPGAVIAVGSGLLFLTTTLQHAYALISYGIAKSGYSNWKQSLRAAWQGPSLRAALLFDILLFPVGVIYYVSWNFYSQKGGLLSLFALGLLFWLAILILLSMGFYFPMLVREEFAFKAAWRKSFVVCLDNPFLAIGLALVALILLAASLFPALTLFFGPVGLALWYEVSLRILYYKYQYLEELAPEERQHGNGRRKKVEIPWRVLLREERERIGPRSLRNFIFPWKD
ncbi:MAG: hypothetical protein AAF975_00300, partial [Spirochaetota bacterium]